MHQIREKPVIAVHDKQEKLVPVMTYVYGLSRPRAISAMLSFLSMCHDDCSRNVRLPDVLSAEDEALCMSLLDEVIDKYLRVKKLPKTTHAKVVKTVFNIMKKMRRESLEFLRNRFLAVCGEQSYSIYWEKIGQAGCFEDVSRLLGSLPGAMQRTRFVDCAIFIIALTVFYGCNDAFHARLALLEEKLKAKYSGGFPFDRIGLCLWPLDFPFVQEEDSREDPDEHLALLGAARSINPDVRVQVCAGSLLWSRDIIAWLTDDYEAYVKSPRTDVYSRFGRGALNEGGNIVTGNAREKFILVAQGPLSDSETAVDFYYAMFDRDIKVYTLPDGFLWSRDPETGKDLLLDSIHIDTVINVVPGDCTVDGRPKIILDPYYYKSVNKDAEFVRFLDEQRVPEADIVIVDERELYLNLPNFSVLIGRDGGKKLLFNKDRGHTLPRLGLKPDAVVQPAIEITKMASCFGSIRCATAMLPLKYVKDKVPLKISISKKLSPETKKTVTDMLLTSIRTAQTLSKLWVSEVVVDVNQKENTSREFDEFSRTAYIFPAPAQAADPEVCGRVVNEQLTDFCRELSKRLGIRIDP